MKSHLVTYPDGHTEWLTDTGIFHREDGPAIEYATGTKYWYLNGRLHRENGPAVEWFDGEKKWCLNGTHYKYEDIRDNAYFRLEHPGFVESMIINSVHNS
jgi:hypothetical protein